MKNNNKKKSLGEENFEANLELLIPTCDAKKTKKISSGGPEAMARNVNSIEMQCKHIQRWVHLSLEGTVNTTIWHVICGLTF